MGKSAVPESRGAVQAPEFDLIPDVLKARALWCCWKGEKRPTRVAGGRLLTGSIHIPQHWLPFDEAAHNSQTYGGWGIGMLLNGDGLVAIDIDGCVHDGEPSPESLAVMRDHGVGYVEFSPSGTGLHGYGFADLRGVKKTRFTLCGIKVEIYSHSRFMTVTGHVVWDSGITELPLLVRALQTYATEDKEDKEDIEEAEDIECHSSESSDSSRSSVACIQIAGRTHQIPKFAKPTGFGQRNEDLFNLARWIKGIDPKLEKKGRHDCVAQWHKLFIDVIRTKELCASVADFEHAWRNVKKPHGESLKLAISRMENYDVPTDVTEMGSIAVGLFKLLASVADLNKSEPFFLACGTAAKVLDCDVSTVSRRLNDFIHMEILCVQEGHTPSKARRFVMVVDKPRTGELPQTPY
uniref:hypothetical protein n=1 Tax=Flavobacterium sp. TaxID=239 RepID=UPI00404892BB